MPKKAKDRDNWYIIDSPSMIYIKEIENA